MKEKFQSKGRERKRSLKENGDRLTECHSALLIRLEIPWARIEETSHQVPDRKDFHCHSQAAFELIKGYY